jgi:hypothetical protein
MLLMNRSRMKNTDMVRELMSPVWDNVVPIFTPLLHRPLLSKAYWRRTFDLPRRASQPPWSKGRQKSLFYRGGCSACLAKSNEKTRTHGQARRAHPSTAAAAARWLYASLQLLARSGSPTPDPGTRSPGPSLEPLGPLLLAVAPPPGLWCSREREGRIRLRGSHCRALDIELGLVSHRQALLQGPCRWGARHHRLRAKAATGCASASGTSCLSAAGRASASAYEGGRERVEGGREAPRSTAPLHGGCERELRE